MNKFFAEFKKFISRGNVIDLAVGVIVGGAFTAIVTSLTSNIFNPLINWVLSGTGDGLKSAVTMLKIVCDDAGNVDMSQCIYINWGAVISAIINFFIIAFVLFIIVRAINKVREAASPKFFGYSKKEYINMRKSGKTRENIKEMAAERDKKAAEEKKLKEEEAKSHTVEGLLEQIKSILEQQSNDNAALPISREKETDSAAKPASADSAPETDKY